MSFQLLQNIGSVPEYIDLDTMARIKSTSQENIDSLLSNQTHYMIQTFQQVQDISLVPNLIIYSTSLSTTV